MDVWTITRMLVSSKRSQLRQSLFGAHFGDWQVASRPDESPRLYVLFITRAYSTCIIWITAPLKIFYYGFSFVIGGKAIDTGGVYRWITLHEWLLAEYSSHVWKFSWVTRADRAPAREQCLNSRVIYSTTCDNPCKCCRVNHTGDSDLRRRDRAILVTGMTLLLWSVHIFRGK